MGGTVGDVESLPFREAARQVRHDVGRGNVFFLHVSLVPYIGPSGELKTKPTQHSVAALRSIGIQPDAIVCRADRDIPESMKRKISLMCDVDEEAVITAADAPSIYDIPKVLHSQGLDAYVVRRLDLPFRDVDWTQWDDLLRRVHEPAEELTIALVGKYVDLPDAYLSAAEALLPRVLAHDRLIGVRRVGVGARKQAFVPRLFGEMARAIGQGPLHSARGAAARHDARDARRRSPRAGAITGRNLSLCRFGDRSAGATKLASEPIHCYPKPQPRYFHFNGQR